MLGVFGKIIGWLADEMGLKTDAANVTGSIHAKISELRARLIERPTSPIKSIQRGITMLDDSQLSVVQVVTAVITSKTELKINGTSWNYNGTGGTAADAVTEASKGYGQLTSSTQLTFTRIYGAGELTFSWELVEYN